MIDLHTHVLPAIDDGPATIEESIELIRAAHAAGTRAMVATPHVSGRYPNRSATIAELTQQLNERLRGEGVDVEILAGAEVAMTKVAELDPGELGRLHLGGGPWILLEPPFTQIATGLERIVGELQRAGHRVVLAHPERCPALLRDPQLVESLVADGVLTSITAGSLSGQFGGHVRRFARALLAQELVHNVASDTHDARKRPPSLAAELADSGLAHLADWLTCAVPAAILAGEPIPSAPRKRQQRGAGPRAWWRPRR